MVLGSATFLFDSISTPNLSLPQFAFQTNQVKQQFYLKTKLIMKSPFALKTHFLTIGVIFGKTTREQI